MADFTSVDYTPQLNITGLDALPRGTGCNHLLCAYQQPTEGGGRERYIAVSWHRSKATAVARRRAANYVAVVVDFQ